MKFNAETINKITEMGLEYMPKLFGAILTFAIGWFLIGMFLKTLFIVMEKRSVEASLRTFLRSFLGIALKIVLLISVASMLGLKTTSLIALLGAAGLAVGLALQGSLSNFAGGVLILLFRPFRVDDLIEAQGIIGTVREITIFNTVLTTPDNKTVFIPNGSLANGAVTNYTETTTRRIEIIVGVSYADDIDKVRLIISKVLEANAEVLKDPAPIIAIHALADNSVNFTVRPWVKNEDYYHTYFDLQEEIKKAFDREKISIPFPQRDVHLYQQSTGSI